MNMFEVSSGHEMKMRIVRAIVDLGKNCDFEAMTVGRICNEADISRQTFYNHFADKYQAVEWYNGLLTKEFCEQVGRDMLWDVAGLRLLQKTSDNRAFYSLILASSQDKYYSPLKTIPDLQYESWRKRLESYEGFEITKKLDFQLRAMSQLGTLMVTQWILDGCKISVDEYYEYMKSCVPQEMRETLDHFVKASR